MAMTKIYFIRNGDFVKIGKSDNPIIRLDVMQTNCPTPLELLGWIEADSSEERELHRRFAAHRERREWFRWCQEISDYCATINPPPAEVAPKEKQKTGLEILAPWQCRAARAVARITLEDLAKLSRVSRLTIVRFENEQCVPIAATIRHVREVLERIGMEFSGESGFSFEKFMEMKRQRAATHENSV